MRAIERTEGRNALLGTESDSCLWGGRSHFVGQIRPTRRPYFYVHGTAAGPVFYLEHRTLWDEGSDYIGLLELDKAQRFAKGHLEDLENDHGHNRPKGLGPIDLGAVE